MAKLHFPIDLSGPTITGAKAATPPNLKGLSQEALADIGAAVDPCPAEYVGASNWTTFLLGMWSLPDLRAFAGKVAMFRLTIGAARYTSNFSPFSEFPKS